ncbi:MAG: hypothetical protein QOE09_1865 [Ilumatobacteraceae bacterium]
MLRHVSDEDDCGRIKASVTAMLPPAQRPWDVAVSRSPHNGGWVIQLEHEASHGLVFDMGVPGVDADATIKRVAEWLTSHEGELRRIATAPLLENADDVMEIRALSHIFNWTRLEVKSVVQVVSRWTLTVDEAEWLITSIGRDGPTPTPSRDF